MEILSDLLIITGFVIIICWAVVGHLVDSFKISYYETKLKNRDVDISHIENITILEILNR